MITAQLNGVDMPPIELDFINTPTENATDVITLDGSIYTDFISQNYGWSFSYDSLTQDEYDVLRAVYDSQFTLYVYPELTIDYYSLTDQPVRMYINEKNIWDNCGSIQNVEITFRQTRQSTYVAPDYLLIDDGELLFINGNSFLLL